MPGLRRAGLIVCIRRGPTSQRPRPTEALRRAISAVTARRSFSTFSASVIVAPRCSRAGTLPHPLSDTAAVNVGGRVIVLGGGAKDASAAVYSLR